MLSDLVDVVLICNALTYGALRKTTPDFVIEPLVRECQGRTAYQMCKTIDQHLLQNIINGSSMYYSIVSNYNVYYYFSALFLVWAMRCNKSL